MHDLQPCRESLDLSRQFALEPPKPLCATVLNFSRRSAASNSGRGIFPRRSRLYGISETTRERIGLAASPRKFISD